MSFETNKELDNEGLELWSTLESVEIETYVRQLLRGNFFSINHHVEPFML